MTDEELQAQFDKGLSARGNDVDSRAYQTVFKALSKEPNYNLPPDFAHRVLTRITERESKKFPFEYFWFGVGILALLGGLAYTLSSVAVTFDLGFLKNSGPMKGLLGFGLLLMLVFNWIDHKFIRKRAANID